MAEPMHHLPTKSHPVPLTDHTLVLRPPANARPTPFSRSTAQATAAEPLALRARFIPMG